MHASQPGQLFPKIPVSGQSSDALKKYHREQYKRVTNPGVPALQERMIEHQSFLQDIGQSVGSAIIRKDHFSLAGEKTDLEPAISAGAYSPEVVLAQKTTEDKIKQKINALLSPQAVLPTGNGQFNGVAVPGKVEIQDLKLETSILSLKDDAGKTSGNTTVDITVLSHLNPSGPERVNLTGLLMLKQVEATTTGISEDCLVNINRTQYEIILALHTVSDLDRHQYTDREKLF